MTREQMIRELVSFCQSKQDREYLSYRKSIENATTAFIRTEYEKIQEIDRGDMQQALFESYRNKQMVALSNYEKQVGGCVLSVLRHEYERTIEGKTEEELTPVKETIVEKVFKGRRKKKE